MKRYGNIFQKIHDIENIKLAHKNARKGKSHYTDVKSVNKNPIMLENLSSIIRTNIYATSPYQTQIINDRGKEREIFILPYYPDRIVQWAIMLQIQDIFMKTFIYDTYASLPGRGIHKAVKRVNKVIRNGGNYCLKLDIKKYFPSIDQEILCVQLERKFKDYKLLDMLFEIIYSIPKGLPIGNYLSQWLANFHLAYFDHDVCNKTRLPYFRYMDDIVLFADSKNKLWKAFEYIKEQLTCLKLTVKENYQIFPSKIRGVDFLGYRSFGDYILLRKRIANNIKKASLKVKIPTKHDVQSMVSYKGWVKYCDGTRLSNKYIKPIIERSIT
jgi:hypothetical protein